MKHTGGRYRIDSARISRSQRRRFLAFEYLEDRRVLASLFGPEPFQCANAAPGAGWIAPSGGLVSVQEQCTQPTNLPSYTGGTGRSSMGNWNNNGNGGILGPTQDSPFNGDPLNGNPFTGEFGQTSSPVFPLSGPLTTQQSSSDDQSSSEPRSSLLKKSETGNQASRPLFSSDRTVAPLAWSAREDATHALEPKFLLGSSDSSERSLDLLADAASADTALVQLLRPAAEAQVNKIAAVTSHSDWQTGLDLLTQARSTSPERGREPNSAVSEFEALIASGWMRLDSNTADTSSNGAARVMTIGQSSEKLDVARALLFAQLDRPDTVAAPTRDPGQSNEASRKGETEK